MAMKKSGKAMSRDADVQFLQRMGTALLLMAVVAGSVTVFGATTSGNENNINLWPVWQLAGVVAAD